MSPAQVLFDDRSANSGRTTGWERYARELLSQVRPHVEVTGLRAEGAKDRILSDLVTLPRRAGARWTHFPTYPPTPTFRGSAIWTLHDLTWWKHPEQASGLGRRYYAPLAKRALKTVPHVVTVSQAIRQELIGDFGVHPDRVTAAPLGRTSLPVSLPAQRARPYLLAVGTLEPRKNLQALIDAYLRSGAAAHCDLVLVGRRGWGEETVAPGVVWISDADDLALSGLYGGALAFFSPSTYEGFGLPLLEAMTNGLPVFCSDIPAYREVSAGLATMFDPHDTDAIAQAVLKAIEVPDDSPRSRAARQDQAATFNWETTGAIVLDLYSRCLDGRGAS